MLPAMFSKLSTCFDDLFEARTFVMEVVEVPLGFVDDASME